MALIVDEVAPGRMCAGALTRALRTLTGLPMAAVASGTKIRLSSHATAVLLPRLTGLTQKMVVDHQRPSGSLALELDAGWALVQALNSVASNGTQRRPSQ